MRILFTGSRRLRDWQPMAIALEQYLASEQARTLRKPAALTLVHGDAKGADSFVRLLAPFVGAKVEAYPAEDFGAWPACGPKRNAHMVSLGAYVCLAFPDPESRGTWDCIRKAADAGIPVRIYPVLAERRKA